MSHFGDLLGGKQTPVSKPVTAPVVEEPPSRESFKVEKEPEVDITKMSKRELELYGRTLGIELDRRLSKSKLLKQVKQAQG